MTDNIVHVDSQPINSNEDHPPRLMANGFDARLFWGDSHVLPRVEASGRWENLPVCRHPGVGYDTTKTDPAPEKAKKKHKLTACLWASASFTTRGNAQSVTDTTRRMVEWIEFHLLVGFDHIYVYDNTGAHTDETSLESTLFPRFLDSEVTRIDWVSFSSPSANCHLILQLILCIVMFHPSPVECAITTFVSSEVGITHSCVKSLVLTLMFANDSIAAHENTGERSSQYAAENSCRARYGPYTVCGLC